MDGDKRNTNSQPPSPLPSRLQDASLSEQWLGAVGEGAFDEEETYWKFCDELELCKRQHEIEVNGYQWEDGINQELSQGEDGIGQELCQGEMQEPAAGTESPVPAPQSPSEDSQALLDTAQQISTEILREAELEIQESEQQLEEQGDLEPTTAAETVTTGTVKKTESLDSLPHSPCCQFSPVFIYVEAKALRGQQAVGEGGPVLEVQETEEGAFAEEEGNWKFYDELELFKRQHETEVNRYQWEDGVNQELFQEEDGIGQQLCQGDLEPSPAAEMQEPAAGTESPVPAPQSPSEDSQALLDPEQSSTSEVLSKAELKIQGAGQDWEEQGDLEQSQRKGSSYHKLPKWEDSSEEEHSQGKGSSYPELTESEESSMEGQPQRKVRNYQELLSDWEDSFAEELSQDRDSFGQEFSDWELYRPSMLSRWEDDSDRELALQDWEDVSVHSFGAKALLPEEDEWEELSVLELSQGQGTEHRLAILAQEGLPVPVPRQAWAERRAPSPYPAGPLCASPPQLEAQAPRGAAAPPALDKQVAEVGTQTQVPRKRPSPFRRALRALHRLFRSCTSGQPQD